jgi:hypothetical protein
MMRRFGKITRQTFFANESHNLRNSSDLEESHDIHSLRMSLATRKTQAISMTRRFGRITRQTFFANEFRKWRWISTWKTLVFNVRAFPSCVVLTCSFCHGTGHELGSCPYRSSQVLPSKPILVIPPNIAPLP